MTYSPVCSAHRAFDVTVLRTIWDRTLGPKVRRAGNIVHVSLGLRRVTRFQCEAEAAFGLRVPLTGLLRLGTFEAIATAMAENRWPDPSPLVMLKDGSADRVLYIVAAGSGVVLEMCDLAQAIEGYGQVWGLQLPGLDGECEPFDDLDAIARHHADHILRSATPRLFDIVGYSFGGLVAVEVGRLLRAAGRPPGFVGLIDSTCHEPYWPRSAWSKVMIRRFGIRIGELRAMPAAVAWTYLQGRARALARRLRRRIDTDARTDPTQSAYYIAGLEPNQQRVRDAAIVAGQNYRPRSYDGPTTLFASAEGDRHSCDPVAIWRPLVPGLDVVVVPGTHTTILRRPHLKGLAIAIGERVLAACADRASENPVWRRRPGVQRLVA